MTKDQLVQRLINMGFVTHGRSTTFAKVVDPETRAFIIVETGRIDGKVNCGLYSRLEEETPDEEKIPFMGGLVKTAGDHFKGATCEEAVAFIEEYDADIADDGPVFVDLPTVGGVCTNVGPFATREEAVAWIRDNVMWCDDDGKVQLISGGRP